MKALPVDIYKHKASDCSNGGISSKYDEILVICSDGFVEVDENNPPENLCKVVGRHLFGKTIYHVEPYAKASGLGWMAGGCYVGSSDSRFDRLFDGYGALSLHDRTESQEEYDRYSA